MIEMNLIKLLETLEAFNKYSDILEKFFISEESSTLFHDIKRYYDESGQNVTKIDWETFGSWFRLNHPMFRPEKHQTYATLVHKLRDMEPISEIDPTIQKLKNQYYSHKIADLGLKGTEGFEKALDEIVDVITEYQATREPEEFNPIVTSDINELVAYAETKGGLKWRLNELNLSYGPIKQADFVLVGARPEVGKTTWLASEVTYMAPQMQPQKRAVWFNNEEAGKKVKLRIIQAALGVTTESILRDPVTALENYERIMGSANRIMVYDKSNLSVRDIEKFLKEHNIGLIVVDQLRKVLGTGIDENNEVQMLGKLFQKARQWAKDYAPVITVHQASADAEGTLFPNGSQLHGVKTEPQGELDLQIMMGRSHDPSMPGNLRGLHVVKSKSTSAKSEHRHAKWEVQILSDIARFKGNI